MKGLQPRSFFSGDSLEIPWRCRCDSRRLSPSGNLSVHHIRTSPRSSMIDFKIRFDEAFRSRDAACHTQTLPERVHEPEATYEGAHRDVPPSSTLIVKLL